MPIPCLILHVPPSHRRAMWTKSCQAMPNVPPRHAMPCSFLMLHAGQCGRSHVCRALRPAAQPGQHDQQARLDRVAAAAALNWVCSHAFAAAFMCLWACMPSPLWQPTCFADGTHAISHLRRRLLPRYASCCSLLHEHLPVVRNHGWRYHVDTQLATHMFAAHLCAIGLQPATRALSRGARPDSRVHPAGAGRPALHHIVARWADW